MNTKGFMKKILTMMLVLAMLITSITVLPETVEAATVGLNKKTATLYINETVKLKVVNTKTKVKWSSSKKSIATVSSKGVVTAKKKGKATILAKVGKKTYKCVVTVKAPQFLSVDTKSIKLKVGESQYIMLTNHMTWLDVPFYFSGEYEDAKSGAVDFVWDEDFTTERKEDDTSIPWTYGFTITALKPGKSLVVIYLMDATDVQDENDEGVEMDRIVIPVNITK